MGDVTKEDRLRLKDILTAHDLSLFRLFAQEHSLLPELVGWDDSKLSDFMHTMKSTQAYFGGAQQASRNALRQGTLSEDLMSSDIKAYRAETGELPVCAKCQYFRTAPLGEDKSCMHTGAQPADTCCVGWELLK